MYLNKLGVIRLHEDSFVAITFLIIFDVMCVEILRQCSTEYIYTSTILLITITVNVT